MKNKSESHLWYAIAGVVVLFVVIFWGYLRGTAVIMTTDAAIAGGADRPVQQVLASVYANWDSGPLMGRALGQSTQWLFIAIWALLGGVLWNNAIYGLACAAASVVFLLGFRKRLNIWAALCGVVAAFWLGSNFSLLYSGHFFKPFIVLFFICAVLAARVKSWPGGILWGGATGLMFVHQPDVAMLFVLFSGSHLLFTLWQREGAKPLRWLPVLIPAFVVSLLFAAGPLLEGYRYQVKDVAVTQQENKIDRWNYMTQWSWPPEECIDYIAPGYSGWGSGDQEGPYWGRKGRSAEWEQTRQGFMNFSLNSAYIGFIPIAFAVFALFAARRSPYRSEILFWGGAAIAAMLLAFGKYFPLYSWFYQLPIVNNIRAPDKFNQVFQLAVAILTAYGVDLLVSGRTAVAAVAAKDTPVENKVPDRFYWLLCGVLGILLVWALGLTASQPGQVREFIAKGWPEAAAQTIVANQVSALWHAVLMAVLSLAAFVVYRYKRFERFAMKGVWIAASLAAVIAVDAVLLSRHYVKPMPRSYIQANDLTQFIKEGLGHERVALLTQQGVYNIWLTYLLPYNQILTFNFPSMPRMATEYKNFLTAMSKDPFRMWRFAGVKYLLGPAAFEKQLPPGQVKKVFSYSIAMTSDNELQVVSSPKGDHAVFELMNPIPRYSLIAPPPSLTEEQWLARLGDSSQPILGPKGQAGTVEVITYRPGRVEVKTKSEDAVMLRVAERWDADWEATVDGKKGEVSRIDYLCQGVAVPSGEHAVVLRYAPPTEFVFMQCFGYLALMVGGLVAVRKKFS